MVRQLAIRPNRKPVVLPSSLPTLPLPLFLPQELKVCPQTPLFCACAGCTSDIANGGTGRLSLANRRSTLNSWVLPAIRLDCIDG
jgi:hypothetical protein